MRMTGRKAIWASAISLVLLAGMLAGCGNVCLRGEALTAAEASALDAWQAARRAAAVTH